MQEEQIKEMWLHKETGKTYEEFRQELSMKASQHIKHKHRKLIGKTHRQEVKRREELSNWKLEEIK